MSIQSELQAFYDLEAKKYANTRDKHRSDADIFLHHITTLGKKHIRILEFGCGSGRLLKYLLQLTGITITYVGVDLSKNLLQFAKQHLKGKQSKHISATFVCDDIIHYAASLKQESFDLIIGVASFQHIPQIEQRFFVLKHLYKALTYEGKLIMTNRSFSWRFLKKYATVLLASLARYISSFGKFGRNDLLIPRKNGTKTYKRFYHIYTLEELKKLVEHSGFIIETLTYLGSSGQHISSRKNAKNTLIIAQKSIFLKNHNN